MKKLYTPTDVAQIVECEGLGYAIECYLDSKSIRKGPLREAWKNAAEALQKVKDLLPTEEEMYGRI